MAIETKEFIPTPDEFMNLMESEMPFKIVASHAHKMFYVYPLDEDALFTLNMMGCVCTNGEERSGVEALIRVRNEWAGWATTAGFEAWRNEFNQSGVRYIPSLL